MLYRHQGHNKVYFPNQLQLFSKMRNKMSVPFHMANKMLVFIFYQVLTHNFFWNKLEDKIFQEPFYWNNHYDFNDPSVLQHRISYQNSLVQLSTTNSIYQPLYRDPWTIYKLVAFNYHLDVISQMLCHRFVFEMYDQFSCTNNHL